MISLYYKTEGLKKEIENLDTLKHIDYAEIAWVDLFLPTEREKSAIEEFLDIHLLTKEEAEEIESTSKYSETSSDIVSNLNFCVMKRKKLEVQPVSFLINGDDILVSMRHANYASFSHLEELLTDTGGYLLSGKEIFIRLLEYHIDNVADMVEIGAKHISELSKNITVSDDIDKSIIKRISELQEQTMIFRENIFDMKRVLSGMKRSSRFSEEAKPRIQLMLEDVESLMNHTDFSFQRLDYLQDVSLGLINIEQNEIVKIFSVAAVIFMPPTLVASIYGMNFKYMPELNWEYTLQSGTVIPIGYIFAIFLMLLFTTLTVWFFRYKKWL